MSEDRRYHAFISYRHGGLDGLVAEKLHRMLETYRAPGAIAKKTGLKKIGLVFRDREELPTSPNLSDAIRIALENSEFLILICSRRLLESQWCIREVELFSELHGKDKIVTLLAEGEPEEAFPQQIRFLETNEGTVEIEPLAADVRAETSKESLKLLKTEKLRILAPLLGCAYDDLRRRHRERRIRAAVAALSGALAFSLSFGGFVTWQYLRINREMRMKLTNQSLVLAEYAENAFNDGDPELSALLALEALPKDMDRPERPYVAAAEKSLADALSVYDGTEGFRPGRIIPLPAKSLKVALSEDESYGAALTPYEITVFRPETGKIALTLPVMAQMTSDFEFLPGNRLVYSGTDGIVCYDLAAGQVLWQGRPAEEITVSGDGQVVAAVSHGGGGAHIYAADGVYMREIDFGGKKPFVLPDNALANPRDSLFLLNGDGSALAVSFDDGSVFLYALRDGDFSVLYEQSPAIHVEGAFYGEFLALSLASPMGKESLLQVIDTDGWRLVAEIPLTGNYARICGDGKGSLYFSAGSALGRMRFRDGSYDLITSVGGNIQFVGVSGDTVMLTSDTGDYAFFDTAAQRLSSHASSYVCDYAAAGERFALTGGLNATSVRVLAKTEGAGETVFSYDQALRFDEARINAAGDRAMLYYYGAFSLYDISGELLRHTVLPDSEAVTDQQYGPKTGNLAVIYRDALRIYSGRDGALLLEETGLDSVFFTWFGVRAVSGDGRPVFYDVETAAPLEADAEQSFAALYDPLDTWFSYRLGDPETDAYFIQDASRVIMAQRHGAPTVYDMKTGARIKTLRKDAYMTGASDLGGNVVTEYVSASGERYALLLNDSFDAVAEFPGFSGVMDGDVLLDGKSGKLKRVAVQTARELLAQARRALNGRTLSPEEAEDYHSQ
jgi:hypothetical protein